MEISKYFQNILLLIWLFSFLFKSWPSPAGSHRWWLPQPCSWDQRPLQGCYSNRHQARSGLSHQVFPDTTLILESEPELKSLLMRVEEESEKAGLKLSILLKSWHGGLVVKNLIAMWEMWFQYLGQEDTLGRENGNPLQYSCLGNPMDWGAWWATVHGVARVGHHWATKPSPSRSWYLIPSPHGKQTGKKWKQ